MDTELDDIFKKSKASSFPKVDASSFIWSSAKKSVSVVDQDEKESDDEKPLKKQKIRNEKTFQENAHDSRTESRSAHENPSSSQTESRKGKTAAKNKDEDVEKNSRTIFVGNVAVSCIKKEDYKLLKSKFKQFGEIESIRFRSAAFSKLMPRKAAFISGKLHEERDSLNCYVVYKSKESACKALELNGTILASKHLRVDLANSNSKCDNRRSVFVGNLPLNIKEEQVWEFFENCGEISNVRIVRDPTTNLGKGFGYVEFKDRSSVTLALQLHGVEFEKRKVRIFKATDDKDARSKNIPAKKTKGTIKNKK